MSIKLTAPFYSEYFSIKVYIYLVLFLYIDCSSRQHWQVTLLSQRKWNALSSFTAASFHTAVAVPCKNVMTDKWGDKLQQASFKQKRCMEKKRIWRINEDWSIVVLGWMVNYPFFFQGLGYKDWPLIVQYLSLTLFTGNTCFLCQISLHLHLATPLCLLSFGAAI